MLTHCTQNAAQSLHLVFNSHRQSHGRQFRAGNTTACWSCGVAMTAKGEKLQGTKEGIPSACLRAHCSLKDPSFRPTPRPLHSITDRGGNLGTDAGML